MPRILLSFGREARLPAYLAALAAGGAAPGDIVTVSPTTLNGDDPADLVRRADGLLFTGGCDVQPELYGEAPDPRVTLDSPSPERDALETALLTAARDRRTPVLAICRGLQLMNVALGGSLWQDLPSLGGYQGHEYAVDAGYSPDRLAHVVVATGEAHPARDWIASRADLVVNSRHHQAVRRASPELATVGVAPDGVVEAMAARDERWWAWGVQWHPENLVAAESHLDLFRRFLTAAESTR
jgi:putative glutamine amidotransferase